jgi:hypothetical protein
LPPKRPTAPLATWTSPQTRKNPPKPLSYGPKLHRNVVDRTVQHFQIEKHHMVRFDEVSYPFQHVSTKFRTHFDMFRVLVQHLGGHFLQHSSYTIIDGTLFPQKNCDVVKAHSSKSSPLGCLLSFIATLVEEYSFLMRAFYI